MRRSVIRYNYAFGDVTESGQTLLEATTIGKENGTASALQCHVSRPAMWALAMSVLAVKQIVVGDCDALALPLTAGASSVA